MNCRRALLGVMMCCWAIVAAATPPASVEAIQASAWLERAGVRQALSVGDALASGDRIHTGPEARVYLRLAEGSIVKLGANADFALHSTASRPERLWTGTLEVLAGAFRFTTDATRKLKARRDLRIRVATSTIGIRGTDVWGRASGEGELVALIEGRIDLLRAGKAVRITPGQYMTAPAGAGATVQAYDAETLARLAAETEILGDGRQEVR